MRYALYLLLLYGSLPLVMARPFLGLCVYFVVSLMEPKMLCWHPYLQDSMIVGVPLVFGALLFGVHRVATIPATDGAGRLPGPRNVLVRHRLIEPSPLLLLMILLVAYVGLMRMFWEIKAPSAADEYSRLCKLALVALLMTGLTPDARRARILYILVALSVGFWAVKGGLWVVLLGPHQVYGADYDDNRFALRSVMVLPMLYCFGQIVTRPRWRWLLFACCVLTCLAIIGSNSRSGFVAMLFVLLCFAWTSGHRIKAGFAVAVLCTAAFVTSGGDVLSRVESIRNFRQDRSAMSRVVRWEIAYDMLARNPIVGVGFGNFERAHEKYAKQKAAHNILIQNVTELGLLGHPLWLGMILGSMAGLYRLARRARRGPPELRWSYHLARGLLIGLAAYWIHGMFHNDEYLDLLFAFVGFTVILRAVYQRDFAELRLRSVSAAHAAAHRTGSAPAFAPDHPHEPPPRRQYGMPQPSFLPSPILLAGRQV